MTEVNNDFTQEATKIIAHQRDSILHDFIARGLALLAVAVRVESRVAEPVVPLEIVKQRTTALSILASLAVGMAMFGGSVFLGQYFQIGRGYSPTEAGLLTRAGDPGPGHSGRCHVRPGT